MGRGYTEEGQASQIERRRGHRRVIVSLNLGFTGGTGCLVCSSSGKLE